MRVTALALLPLLLLSAAADAEELPPSCRLLLDQDVTDVSGAAASVGGSSGDEAASECLWLVEGQPDIFVRVTLITAEAMNVSAGTALEYFHQMQANDTEQLGAEAVRPIAGIGQAAYVTTIPDSPLPAFSFSLLQDDDTITVYSQGLDLVRTLALSHLAASRAAGF